MMRTKSISIVILLFLCSSGNANSLYMCVGKDGRPGVFQAISSCQANNKVMPTEEKQLDLSEDIILRRKIHAELIEAIRTKDKSIKLKTQQFILKGGDINNKNPKINKYLLLHFAIKHENAAAIKELLRNKADPNITDYLGNTIFHFVASNEKKFKYLELFSTKNININAKNISGETAIYIAVKSMSEYAVEKLIKLGAKVKGDVNEGRILFLALRNKNILEMLLKLGADPNLSINKFSKRLLSLVASSAKNIEVAELLIKYGADLNYVQGLSGNALHVAVKYGRIEMAKLLLEAGIDANAVNCCNSNETAMHFAAKYNNSNMISMVNLLLKWGGNINAAGVAGRSPLIEARNKSSEMVEHLIKNGADVNYRDMQGHTALTWYINRNNPAIEVLIKYGARLNLDLYQDKKAFNELKKISPELVKSVI